MMNNMNQKNLYKNKYINKKIIFKMKIIYKKNKMNIILKAQKLVEAFIFQLIQI